MQNATSDEPIPSSLGNLEFILGAMNALGNKHSITKHFTAQLELDISATALGDKEKMYYTCPREVDGRTGGVNLPNTPINGLLAERHGVPMTFDNLKHYTSISAATEGREDFSSGSTPQEANNSSGAATVDTRSGADDLWDTVTKPNESASMKDANLQPSAPPGHKPFQGAMLTFAQIPFGADKTESPSDKLQPRHFDPTREPYAFPFRSAEPTAQSMQHDIASWPDRQPQLQPEPEPPAFYLANPTWFDPNSLANESSTNNELDALLDGIVWDSNPP